ncbi:MAG: bifunctional phosphoribosylaminoimidazolecarboxamide formyltransferase/inosine monophosphate cyclohydrolase [Bacteroidetes bacterium]|nr:MAG: bifunctional phosphoribosylaminoimidazolecarboxamide formyltransferase/inosine monophosphate cyclohydrolase [Bacteroidota bacterium]
MKAIKTALISVYHKDNLTSIIRTLARQNVQIYSTGGTYEFITQMGIDALTVESVTGYPSILGGRVKTLHPKVFGGILSRRDHDTDAAEMKNYEIPYVDLVITDLYPFEQTTQETDCEEEIIEKIDIGGISLIRAAAKNYRDVMIVPSMEHYQEFEDLLNKNEGVFSLEERKRFAGYAFNVSSHYDMAIYQHFSKKEEQKALKISELHSTALRYGENPHQKGSFHGKLEAIFSQLHGKALSYNNLVDIDAAISLILEFEDPTFAILKHTNACGCATRPELLSAYQNALAGDPVSAFGGVFISNQPIDIQTAEEINKLFFEVILAPGYEESALKILQSKKNRIILKKKNYDFSSQLVKTSLNGYIVQDRDETTETKDNLTVVTRRKPSDREIVDLLFANKLVKHTKSNAIVLAKEEMLLGSGTGQTSRIDALKQAITKAGAFNLPLEGAVMASDAFFPFPDNVEEAWKAGIKAVIQPGGSIRDQQSIDFCDAHDMAMVFTGVRHFKH